MKRTRKPKNWIQGAIKKPGSFGAQAKKAGMSPPAFDAAVLSTPQRYSPLTVKRARLAKTLMGLSKAKKGR